MSLSHSVRPFIPALIFLVAAFAVVPTGAVDAQDDDPGLQHMVGWSLGDKWVWHKEATSAVPAGTEGDIVFRVVSAERITMDLWNGSEHPEAFRTHQVWRVKVWANQTANTGGGPVAIQTEQDRFYRRDDLAQAKILADSSFTGGTVGGQERIHEMFPPQIEMQFPFAIEDKWRMRVHQKNLNPDDGSCGAEGQPSCRTITNKLHTYTVLGQETISIRLGQNTQRFESYKILVTEDLAVADLDHPDEVPYDIIWWSPQVCNIVKREEYNAQRVLEYRHTLTDYRCAGRDVPDPTYSIYDFQNFSSMRFHGELAVDPLLQDLVDGPDEKGFLGGGGLFQGNGDIPGPALPAALLALIGLAAIVARKRRA